ncbi:MAG: helix-turn-helix transcriptional regulator [Coprobacillus sp.]|nr:helix-turn-helix transcriptional regulator [Coprobacillus sp.]DAP77165.1 MAG TPA: helix-turn-helix domain protein [Caudoviricetes sp.]
MSLREFADLIGISHTYLKKLETGINPNTGKPVSPTIEMLSDISKSLHVSLEYLLEMSGYLKVNNLADEYQSFTTPQEALNFILKQEMIADYGGYDLDTMSDDEIMEMAEDVGDMLKIVSRKHRK